MKLSIALLLVAFSFFGSYSLRAWDENRVGWKYSGEYEAANNTKAEIRVVAGSLGVVVNCPYVIDKYLFEDYGINIYAVCLDTLLSGFDVYEEAALLNISFPLWHDAGDFEITINNRKTKYFYKFNSTRNEVMYVMLYNGESVVFVIQPFLAPPIPDLIKNSIYV